MYLLSGVTIDGEDSASSRQRSSSATIPSTVRSASRREMLASRRIDSSRLRAITGSMTLSSKLPAAPAKAMAASLPMTCAQTMWVASGMTGFTLPGMIDDPGCRSGSWISPSPARGPEPIQRMSLQILCRPTAIVRSWPEASTSPSRAPCASKWSRASVSGRPVAEATSAMTAALKPGGVLMPVPTAVPPSGSSASRGREACRRSTPYRTWAA